MPWEPKPRMEETVNNTALDVNGSPEGECQYSQAADGEPLNQRTAVIWFLLITAVISSGATTFAGH